MQKSYVVDIGSGAKFESLDFGGALLDVYPRLPAQRHLFKMEPLHRRVPDNLGAVDLQVEVRGQLELLEAVLVFELGSKKGLL